jgi:ketosteroid isomerase-like protein
VISNRRTEKEVPMSSEALARAQRGFEAWQRGDLETIGEMLDPDVRWHWFEPGDWDCNGRDQVIRTLRDRYDNGFARAPLELFDAGEDVVIAVIKPREAAGPDRPEESANVIRFSDGKVVSMQDFRSKDEALASLNG